MIRSFAFTISFFYNVASCTAYSYGLCFYSFHHHYSTCKFVKWAPSHIHRFHHASNRITTLSEFCISLLSFRFFLIGKEPLKYTEFTEAPPPPLYTCHVLSHLQVFSVQYFPSHIGFPILSAWFPLVSATAPW